MQKPHVALIVVFKLVISGLTSVILIVLGTVNLQFQGPFVPISLWPVLGNCGRNCPGYSLGGQSIGTSASTSVLPVNIQG